jgi:hypothetical protein
MTQNEALRLALEALEDLGMKHYENTGEVLYKETFAAIKAALEAKNEPVAWISPTELLVMRGNALGGAKDWRVNLGLTPEEGDVGLYTTPPQRTWVGLTDEEIVLISADCAASHQHTDIHFARAIEAKLKEKNT